MVQSRTLRRIGLLIELCLDEVTPPGSPHSRRTWAALADQLNVSSATLDPRLMGRSYEKHRSQGDRCSKLRLARLAQAMLLELYGDWLARLHGYRDAAAFGASNGAWESALGGRCRAEEEEAMAQREGDSDHELACAVVA